MSEKNEWLIELESKIFPSLIDRLPGDCRSIVHSTRAATLIIENTRKMWIDEDGKGALRGIKDNADFTCFQRVIDTQSYKKVKEDVLKLFNATLILPVWLWKEMYWDVDLPPQLMYFEQLREDVSKYLKETYSSTSEVDEYFINQCKTFFSRDEIIV